MRKVLGKDLREGDIIWYSALKTEFVVRANEPTISNDFQNAIFTVIDKDELDLYKLKE